jgi:hypothetical protein
LDIQEQELPIIQLVVVEQADILAPEVLKTVLAQVAEVEAAHTAAVLLCLPVVAEVVVQAFMG